MNSKRAWQFVLAIYVLGLGVVSLLAYTNQLHVTALMGRSHLDKLLHFVLLGGASFLARRATSDARMRFFDMPVGPFVVGVIATMDECVQGFAPSRTFSLGDLAANIGGVVVFGWVAGLRLFGAVRKDRSDSKGLS